MGEIDPKNRRIKRAKCKKKYNRYLQIRINDEQLKDLKIKSEKAGLTQSNFVRALINGAILNEKPDDKFYEVIPNIAQFTQKLGDFIFNVKYYKDLNYESLDNQLEKWENLLLEIKQKYL